MHVHDGLCSDMALHTWQNIISVCMCGLIHDYREGKINRSGCSGLIDITDNAMHIAFHAVMTT